MGLFDIFKKNNEKTNELVNSEESKEIKAELKVEETKDINKNIYKFEYDENMSFEDVYKKIVDEYEKIKESIKFTPEELDNWKLYEHISDENGIKYFDELHSILEYKAKNAEKLGEFFSNNIHAICFTSITSDSYLKHEDMANDLYNKYLELVKINPFIIRYLKNNNKMAGDWEKYYKYNYLILQAIRKNGYAIKYIFDIDADIGHYGKEYCLEAINENEISLDYMEAIGLYEVSEDESVEIINSSKQEEKRELENNLNTKENVEKYFNYGPVPNSILDNDKELKYHNIEEEYFEMLIEHNKIDFNQIPKVLLNNVGFLKKYKDKLDQSSNINNIDNSFNNEIDSEEQNISSIKM